MGEIIEWFNPNRIGALAACASAFAAIITAWSIVLLKKQISTAQEQTKYDHERSRRERALEVMMCFVNQHSATDHQITFAIALIYELNPEQCRALWKKEVFSVSEKQQQFLEAYRKAFYAGFQSEKRSSNNAVLTKPGELTPLEVRALNRIAASVCNKLELIASAWANNVADREMIEKEFVAVFCPETGKYVLETFREASGIFPSIKQICEHYRSSGTTRISRPPIAT